MPTSGTVFVHRNESGIRIDASIPTGVPVSEIRAIQYTGSRSIKTESILNLENWLRDRIDEGFIFESAS